MAHEGGGHDCAIYVLDQALGHRVDRVLVVFFFSSRRRHTSSLCDWSSDVCSSDLAGAAQLLQPAPGRGGGRIDRIAHVRSEERRVGKEGRSPRWTYQSTKTSTIYRASSGRTT